MTATVRPLLCAILLSILGACGPGEPSKSGTPPQSPDGGTARDEDAALLAFVFDQPKPEGYRPYAPGTPRADLPPLPETLEPVAITVDASRRGEPFPPILDEVNVWKAYSTFHPRNRLNDRFGEGFLRFVAPWWTWARVPAALGGSYTPHIAAACDAAKNTPEHAVDGRDCGKGGEPGSAAWYEPVRLNADGMVTWDFEPLRLCMGEIMRAGLLPHLNISSAHSVFTGYRTTMLWYHWNEEPVRDHPSWMDFVAAALQALRHETLPQWRFSVVNEPNCLRQVGSEILPVGYRGGPEAYARQFVSTVRAIRRVLPEARVHAGNYVISTLMEEEKNLHHYLRALRAELESSGIMRWEDCTFYSLSIYDVPHKGIYGMSSTKFRQFQRFREALGLAELPIKVDEFDIHPDVYGPYNATHELPFQYTWYSAAWLANAFEVFRTNGVRSAAAWVGQVFHRDRAAWTPTPRYWMFVIDSLLAGRIELLAEGQIYPQMAPREPGAADPAFHRLAVRGGMLPDYRGEGYRYRSVQAVATQSADGGTTRVLLAYDTSALTSDEDTVADPHAVSVSLRIEGLAPGSYRAKVYAIGPWLEGNGPEERWIRWDPQRQMSRPFLPVHERELTVEEGGSGVVTIHPGGADSSFALGRHSVLFVDLRRG